MRALRVSVRMRRLPRKKMLSMTVPGCCAGGSWAAKSAEPRSSWSPAAGTEVTFGESEESNLAERCEDGDATAGVSKLTAGTADASNNTIAANESRTRVTPNGKETLV